MPTRMPVILSDASMVAVFLFAEAFFSAVSPLPAMKPRAVATSPTFPAAETVSSLSCSAAVTRL